MSKFFSQLLLSTSACLILALNGCKKEAQPVVVEKDSVPRFAGKYSADDKCTATAANYILTLTKSTTADNTVVLENIFNFGSSTNYKVLATVSGFRISISEQTFNGNAATKFTISGSGTIDDKSIMTIDYTLKGDVTETCKAICRKL